MKSSLTKILVFTTILLSVASCRLIPKDQVPVNLKTVKITVSDSGNKEKNINNVNYLKKWDFKSNKYLCLQSYCLSLACLDIKMV